MFFLVVDEESAALTHHLPVGFEGVCFFVSASGLGCRLVVEISTSRSKNFDSLLKTKYSLKSNILLAAENANTDLPCLEYSNKAFSTEMHRRICFGGKR